MGICPWAAEWGDVSSWVGAIGTVGALLWAIVLYSRDLDERKSSQARHLTQVGTVSPTQVLKGHVVQEDSTIFAGVGTTLSQDKRLVLLAEALQASVRVVSTSDEVFTGVRAWLVQDDGTEVVFSLGFDELAPGEERTWTDYYRLGDISGGMRVRLQYRDANGRWWERINGEPVRPLRKGPRSLKIERIYSE